MDYNINFPNLHIFLDHVGKNIMIGDFSIAYYGIVIACGMIGGVLLATTIAKRSGQNVEDYYDIALYAIVLSVIGARLYYVIFNWEYYAKDWTRIFNIREGGLAIYGAIITAIITVYIICRVKKISFWLVADTAAPALIFGQILGRWGNFFNREAFGDYTDNLLAMQLPITAVRKSEITEKLWEHTEVIDGITYIQVHPTFLYESLWNLAVLILLLVYWKHKKFNGEVFFLYLLGYGVGRFWIESLRTDQLILPVLEVPVSMVVAAIMSVAAIVGIILGRKKAKAE
ncbi:MAG: prolipoprotein diacylglyceryl transferase [Agathobacter sp.]|nr:prolipoprotein diacylglyceryl transferase [Agathobacter sp.]